jgi:hypothetical protein
MPLVSVATLLRVADRAAYQYGQIIDTMTAISQQGTDYYWQTITDTDDPDVEIPCEALYLATDEDLEPGLVGKYGTLLSNIIVGMENHFARNDGSGQPLQAGGWDGYLTSEDQRVSQYFGDLFFAVKGYYMLANDVFSEGDDQFADVEVIVGPAIQFTDGINYGNGAATNPANDTYFAATQLKVVVVTMGAANLDLRLSVKDKNDNPTTIDVTVPAGSAPGTEIDVGGASDRFLDVIGAAFVPAGSMGTLGDEVTVRNKKERQIAL